MRVGKAVGGWGCVSVVFGVEVCASVGAHLLAKTRRHAAAGAEVIRVVSAVLTVDCGES